MSISYILVSHGSSITESSNQAKISSIIINKVLPLVGHSDKVLKYGSTELNAESSNNKLLYIKHLYGNHYCCIASDDIKQRICWKLLNDVAEEQYITKQLLKQKLGFYNNPENDKIQLLQLTVDKIRDKMVDNMDKILTNQESLDNLITSSDELAVEARYFQKGSRSLKRATLIRLLLIISCIVGSILVGLAIMIIVLAVHFSK